MPNHLRESVVSTCRGSAAFALALLVTACSGGGGGGGTTVGPGPGPGPGSIRAAETAVLLTEDRLRLIGVADDGSGAEVELSAPAFTQVRQFAVSPDGGAVAYIADCDQLDRHELYVREIAGAAPVRVSSTMNSFNDVSDFAWAPDSASLAYRADGIVDDRAEMFRVGRDGSNGYRVYQSGIASIYVSGGYSWSPDSRYLTVLLQQTATRFELRLHDATTGVEGASTVLFVPPGRQILDVRFSPDSQWLAMRADHAGALGLFEVFRQRTDLSGSLLRSNGAVAGVVAIAGYSWSADSQWLAQQVVAFPAGTPIGVNTYEIASDVSRRVVTTATIDDVRWSPVSARLALAAGYDPATGSSSLRRLLLHDPIANTLQVVHDPVITGEQLLSEGGVWSPDASRIAYVTGANVQQQHTWLAMPGSVQAPVVVVGVQNLEVVTLAWSTDSSHLGLLERNQNAAFHPGEWHIAGLDGITSWSSGSINTYDTSRSMRWSSDSKRAVYVVAASGTGSDQLRGVGADGVGDGWLSSRAADDEQRFGYARASLSQP